MDTEEQKLKSISENAQADYLVAHRLFSWKHPYAFVYLMGADPSLDKAVTKGINAWNKKTIFHFWRTDSVESKNALVKIKDDPKLLKKIGALGLTKHPHHNDAWYSDQVIIGIDLAFFKKQELLNNVVTHELGHALGLPDVHFKSIEYGRDDRMYWLQPCDILAVKKLYGPKAASH